MRSRLWFSLFVLTVLLAAKLPRPSTAAPPPPTNPTLTHQIFLPFTARQSGPAAQELIAAALERGQIDPFTAVLYRLYALTGDDRLPPTLRGRGAVEDLDAFTTAQDLLPSLTPAQQALLQPFLLFPDHPDSAWSQDQLSASSASSDALTAAPCWTAHQSTAAGVKVKLWAACDLQSEAQVASALAMMEALWGPMTALMGEPRLDIGGPQFGGSNYIDIYLVDPLDEIYRPLDYSSGIESGSASGIAPVTNRSGTVSSGYILLDRSMLRSSPALFKAVLAHEFFHVLEHAHNYKVHFTAAGVEWWFTEASAEWAAVHFVPEASAYINHSFADTFQPSRKALNVRAKGGSADQPLLYAAYIWPFFMEMELGPQAIASAWDMIAGVGPDQDAADLQVDRILSFDLHFHRFAVRNLNLNLAPNDPLAPRYISADENFPDGHTPLPLPSTVLLEGDQESQSATLPRLKANYYKFIVDEGVSTVTLTNSNAAVLDLDVVGKKRNGAWSVENFSGQSQIKLCDLESFYVVVSNPKFAINNQESYTLGAAASAGVCTCDLSGIAAFTGSASFNYSYSASGNNYTYSLNQSASASNRLPRTQLTSGGATYSSLATGTGSLNDVETWHIKPPVVTTLVGSGGLVGRPVDFDYSTVYLNFSLSDCTYNVYFGAAVDAVSTRSGDPPGSPHPTMIGTAHTEWLPIPDNFILAGTRTIPAHSDSWVIAQPELVAFYWPGGFGEAMFWNTLGDMVQAGSANYSYHFEPSP